MAISVGAVAIAGCLAVGAGPMTAAPQPSTRADLSAFGNLDRTDIHLDDGSEASVVARAGHVRDALGFPVGVSRVGKHVSNGLEKAEYDEVTEFDAKGSITSLTQFDSNGQLRAAVRFDKPHSGRKVAQDEAVDTATRAALAVGLSAGEAASSNPDEATGGWTVRWARLENGVRVRGDETRIQVWPNGQIQSVARIEHELAAAPAQAIGLDQAQQVVADNLDRWFAGHDVGYDVQRVTLEWVEPNGAFDPSLVRQEEVPCRLAYVAEVKPSGNSAEYIWLISVFVDAEDGTIIGGDFVE